MEIVSSRASDTGCSMDGGSEVGTATSAGLRRESALVGWSCEKGAIGAIPLETSVMGSAVKSGAGAVPFSLA